MNEEQIQQAFLQFLMLETGALTEEELQAAIQLMGEEGLKLEYAKFMQLILSQAALIGRLGMKFRYIDHLRGKCPVGYTPLYYKAGGRVCKRCVKKAAEGDDLEIEDTAKTGQSAIDSFKEKSKNAAMAMIPGLGIPAALGSMIAPIARNAINSTSALKDVVKELNNSNAPKQIIDIVKDKWDAIYRKFGKPLI